MKAKVTQLKHIFDKLHEIEEVLDILDERKENGTINEDIYSTSYKVLDKLYGDTLESVENLLKLWTGNKPESDYQCVAQDIRTNEWWGFDAVVKTADGLKAVTPDKLSNEKQSQLKESERILLEELHSEGFDTVVTEDNKRYVYNSVTHDTRRVPLLDLVHITGTRVNLEELIRGE